MNATPAGAITRPPLRYFGGKFRLAPWIIEHFPPHEAYVESFGGGAGVLLRKAPADVEVYNDLDGDIVNVFRVLRDPAQARALEVRLTLTPFARAEFELTYEPTADPVEAAARTITRSWLGFGTSAATKGTTGFRTSPKDARLWRAMGSLAEGLGPVTARLRGVLLECRPGIEVMLRFDGADVLHYVDPPYLFATRDPHTKGKAPWRRYYRHEMTDWQHQDLLTALRNLKGYVVLSCYDNPLYREALQGWWCTSRSAAASGGRFGGVARTETLWLNPQARGALP